MIIMDKVIGNEPLISVLIPAYIQQQNQLEHLKESIHSVLAQTYPNIEIIIVDDGCYPEAQALLKEFSDNNKQIVLHKNLQNEGIVFSLNRALEISSGEFIARHDSDDICFPERFEKQLNYLNNNPQCCAVFTGSIDIDEHGNELDYFPVTEVPKIIKAELLLNSRLRHPSLMVRQQALLNIKGYQNHYLAEDYDLFSRLVFEGELHGLNEPLLYYRRYENTNVNKREQQLDSAANISYIYINRLLEVSSLEKLKKVNFLRFWFYIQTRGKSPCTIFDIILLSPLWELFNQEKSIKAAWHKEIINCIKHGYNKRSKIQAVLMYFYLKFRLSI